MSKDSTLRHPYSSMAGASRSRAMATSDNGLFGAGGHEEVAQSDREGVEMLADGG